MRNLIILLALATGQGVFAADKPDVPAAGTEPVRAARSVHLFYPAPEAVVFYNEVTVEQSQKGSYFMACGFSHGYFGIQERADDKVVIFSVWDPGDQNSPSRVEEEKRVQVLYGGPDVEISRFGGEGTGARCLFPYDWKIGEPYKFCVTAETKGDRTLYAGYFYIHETGQWKHLATLSTIAKGDFLEGCYSFVEDFRRDGKSVQEMRRSRFANGWIKTAQGDWMALTRARFTADSTPLMNINSGVVDGGFFLQTGGETQNETKLGSTLERLPAGVSLPIGD